MHPNEKLGDGSPSDYKFTVAGNIAAKIPQKGRKILWEEQAWF